MEARLRIGSVASGRRQPYALTALREEGILRPAPNTSPSSPRYVEPKELLIDFLGTDFAKLSAVTAYLKRNGLPVKHAGRETCESRDAGVVIFNKLADLALEFIGEEQVRHLREQYLRAAGFNDEYFKVDELLELQCRIKDLTEVVSSALVRKSLPQTNLLYIIEPAIKQTRLRVGYDHENVGSRRARIPVLEAVIPADFEVCLYVGVLQLLVEGAPIRYCAFCNKLFQMKQRRSNRKFCDVVCKIDYFNAKRRRKHEQAANAPPSAAA
jgi:predicted RNA-binding Zn ribbon-like protein